MQSRIHWYRTACAVLAVIALLAAAVGLISDESPRDWLVNDRLYAKEIKAAAKKHNLDPLLVRSVVFQESRFDPFAIGDDGEYGLMQVLPSGSVTDWARINRRPKPSNDELTDPELNLEIGCWYLGKAVKKWKNYRCGIELALAEYNAGAKNSARWKPANPNAPVVERIDFPVTRNYVQQIMKYYRKYSSEAGGGFKNP